MHKQPRSARIGVLGGRPRYRAAFLGLLAIFAALLVVTSNSAHAALQPGTPAGDVIIGRDNDNAANTFIQPANVAAKQHLDNTDVLEGGFGGDLLIGMLGSDVVDGGAGVDILVGGVENFVAPNSDVIRGGPDNDINIWAPGDGSDLFAGNTGHDVQLFAPIVLENGKPQLFHDAPSNRRVPHVSIDNKPQFTCTIEAVPAAQQLGVQFITRFFANGNLAVTVRQQDVEWVLCPSPNPGKVLVADLTSSQPTTFVERSLRDFRGTLLGAIIQAQ